ncbi:hypothetical protein FOT80_25455 [Serratia fonticola]|nr:hypothetical protein [Serratia fonticola]
MSFTIEKKLLVRKLYTDIGVQMDMDEEIIPVTYDVVALEMMDKETAIVRYNISVNGAIENGVQKFEFKYLGGNPLKEAEDALKCSLSGTLSIS